MLPIALPGIVTGVALQNTFNRTVDLGPFDFRIGFGFHSLVIAHATFCVVLAYNNVDRPPAPLVTATCSRRRPTSAPTAARRSAT